MASQVRPERRPSWFVRHKVVTGLVVLTVVGFGMGERETDPEGVSADGAEATAAATATTSTSAGPREKRESSEDDLSARPARAKKKSQAAQTARTARSTKTARSTETESAKTVRSSPQTAPKSKPKAKPKAAPRVRTYLVSRVIDGDTIELGNGEDVRVVGIDTPEVGECGYDEAGATMARLVLGKRVRLTMSDEDRDHYDRLLRYVNIGTMDAGLRQIKSGLATARYDSRDGYGYHARENVYIANDEATPNKTCAKPAPLVARPAPKPGAGCAPGYSPCVPPYGPDLDCADVDGPIRVTGSDPHGLDGEGDGIACE